MYEYRGMRDLDKDNNDIFLMSLHTFDKLLVMNCMYVSIVLKQCLICPQKESRKSKEISFFKEMDESKA